MTTSASLIDSAAQLADSLATRLAERKTDRVVFAESCTAGLVAALLGQTPGISQWLCGSAVTYRESVKQDWLGVSPETLKNATAESQATTSEMAIGVLSTTREATFSAAVTGHLGPGAPPEIDGKIHIAIGIRRGAELEILQTKTLQLKTADRVERQFEAAKCVLDVLLDELC